MTDYQGRRLYQRLILWLLLGCLGFGGVISLRLAIARHQAPSPQGILVLEGRTQRVRFAAQVAQRYDNLPIWVSGNPRGQVLNQLIFQRAGIDAQRLHFDACATDTVTNFTCTVRDIRAYPIQHIYVVTSDYHMPRSLAIAAIVFGSHGIVSTPLVVPSIDYPTESPWRTVRDCVRSLIWLFTGVTGASLRRFLPD